MTKLFCYRLPIAAVLPALRQHPANRNKGPIFQTPLFWRVCAPSATQAVEAFGEHWDKVSCVGCIVDPSREETDFAITLSLQVDIGNDWDLDHVLGVEYYAEFSEEGDAEKDKLLSSPEDGIWIPALGATLESGGFGLAHAHLSLVQKDVELLDVPASAKSLSDKAKKALIDTFHRSKNPIDHLGAKSVAELQQLGFVETASPVDTFLGPMAAVKITKAGALALQCPDLQGLREDYCEDRGLDIRPLELHPTWKKLFKKKGKKQ